MSGVTGATLDSIGQVYFATPLGVQMCEANGRTAAILNSPEPGAITHHDSGRYRTDFDDVGLRHVPLAFLPADEAAQITGIGRKRSLSFSV